MVKFKGIEISIVSQFDIRRLPEYRYLDAEDSNDPFHCADPSSRRAPSIASCYVPTYPGSQIWFEYAIDGPHPPKSAYFFKFLLNGRVVTSWDCTEKHGYHGKMMYNIICEGKDEFTGQLLMRRQGFKFENHSEHRESSTMQGDLIEIRIHRISNRKRIKILETEAGHSTLSERLNHSLTFTDGGLVDGIFPQRRFSYHLLDPSDEPYATFRFYCRSYDYLEEHRLISISSDHSSFGTTSSSEDQQEALRSENYALHPISGIDVQDSTFTKQSLELSKAQKSQYHSPTEISGSRDTTPTRSSGSKRKSSRCHLHSNPKDSLSMLAKDSIEDIPSSVKRSPKGPRPLVHARSRFGRNSIVPDLPPSPSKNPWRQKDFYRKEPSINFDEIGSGLEIARNPLSPFTNGGALRSVVNTRPTSTSSHSFLSSMLSSELNRTSSNEQDENGQESHTEVMITNKERQGRRSLRGLFGKKSSLGESMDRERDI